MDSIIYIINYVCCRFEAHTFTSKDVLRKLSSHCLTQNFVEFWPLTSNLHYFAIRILKVPALFCHSGVFSTWNNHFFLWPSLGKLFRKLDHFLWRGHRATTPTFDRELTRTWTQLRLTTAINSVTREKRSRLQVPLNSKIGIFFIASRLCEYMYMQTYRIHKTVLASLSWLRLYNGIVPKLTACFNSFATPKVALMSLNYYNDPRF